MTKILNKTIIIDKPGINRNICSLYSNNELKSVFTKIIDLDLDDFVDQKKLHDQFSSNFLF